MLGGFIMNLTLRQLFKYGVVCLGACALSATALDTVSDSFEAPDGSLDLPIGEYKMVVSGAQSEITNVVWYAAAGDASTIVSNDAAYADIEGDGPISNTTAELILNLETEGNTLSRTAGVSIAGSDVAYIDSLIQFTPSEDDPVIEMADVKVALYVNALSNLVVVHTFYEGGVTPVVTNSVIAGTIDPAVWYRLSMQVETLAGSFPGTKIFLDGVAISHANAYTSDLTGTGGEWFINTDSASDIDLISFQGTGLLDELVVSDEMPDFAGPSVIQITLVAAGGNVAFLPAATVDSGTSVTMTSDDWMRIVTVVGDINEDLSGELPAMSVITTLTAAASCEVTVTVAEVSGDYDIGGGTYDAGTVATWATTKNAPALAEDEVTAAMEDDYLLNVEAGTDASLIITSIVVDDVLETVTVTVAADILPGAGGPDFTALNGTLNVYSTDDLGVGFVVIGSGDVIITPTAPEATVVIDISGSSYDFVKAKVE
jgi:hypothetical protein